MLDYPRRKPQHYKDCGIYFSGTTTTLKIYNKLLEFNKNDRAKLKNMELFNIFEHIQKIKGFVRFEVEIKNKKLLDMFQKKYGAIVKNVRCKDFEYFDFEGIWVDDFMKVIKVNFNGMKLISDKEEVRNRLLKLYDSDLGFNLYNFYLSIIVDGYKKIQEITPSSTFYRKINKLKNAGVDFSSNNYDIVYKNKNEVVDIFEMCEVV